jgi:hypothetical protein
MIVFLLLVVIAAVVKANNTTTTMTTTHEDSSGSTTSSDGDEDAKCAAYTQSGHGCAACVAAKDAACVWCLATASCTPNSTVPSKCRFSARRECCNTLSDCASCAQRIACGWCAGVGCRAGDEHGDVADYCAASDWTFSSSKCPLPTDSQSAGAALLLGVATTVGAFFVLLGGTLLVLVAVRSVQRNKARAALERYARAVRRHVTPCDRCKVVAAHWRCRQCGNASLCARCAGRVHGRGARAAHRLEKIASQQAAVTATAARDDAATYTSFSAMLTLMQDNPTPLLAEEVGLQT